MRQAVLIVDDNPDFCGVAASILRNEGFVVDEVSDARLAIARLRTIAYAVVVVEPSPVAGFAPVFDFLAGSEDALQHVVAATTENDDDLVQRLDDAGVFRVLHKPFARKALSDAVRDCARNARPLRP